MPRPPTALDGGTALAHAVEFGTTGAVVHDVVEAAGAGNLSGFLDADTPLRDRARALCAAAVNERRAVLDELLACGLRVTTHMSVCHGLAARSPRLTRPTGRSCYSGVGDCGADR